MISSFSSDKERYAEMRRQVHAWLNEGYHTVALIEKTRAGAEHLYKLLKNDLPVHLMKEDDSDYHGGVLILPAAMVKGLEFDCVAVCNASSSEFADEPFPCRMLYVMLTRPLHRLRIFATGQVTPLLEK